jgi:ribulose-phosphate 3-epimerase
VSKNRPSPRAAPPPPGRRRPFTVPALAPSLLSADFSRLADEIKAVEAGGAGLLHVDVMDGHFVPNLTLGPAIVASVRRVTELKLDVHLMVQDPDPFIEPFARAGADMISVHQETVPHLNRTITCIKDVGAAAGVVLNPSTPLLLLQEILPSVDYVLLMSVNPGFGGQRFIPSVMNKVAELRRLIDGAGYTALVEVDGGVGPDNIAELRDRGAQIFVAGSAVFGGGDPRERARDLVERLSTRRPRE